MLILFIYFLISTISWVILCVIFYCQVLCFFEYGSHFLASARLPDIWHEILAEKKIFSLESILFFSSKWLEAEFLLFNKTKNWTGSELGCDFGFSSVLSSYVLGYNEDFFQQDLGPQHLRTIRFLPKSPLCTNAHTISKIS